MTFIPTHTSVNNNKMHTGMSCVFGEFEISEEICALNKNFVR